MGIPGIGNPQTIITVATHDIRTSNREVKVSAGPNCSVVNVRPRRSGHAKEIPRIIHRELSASASNVSEIHKAVESNFTVRSLKIRQINFVRAMETHELFIRPVQTIRIALGSLVWRDSEAGLLQVYRGCRD